MKKILYASIAILIIALACIYIFIPGELKTTVFRKINCPAAAAERFIASKNKWAEWWPQKNNPGQNQFYYNGSSFNLIQAAPGTAAILIQDDQLTFSSTLTSLPLSKDSAILNYQSIFKTSANPLERFSQYRTWVQVRDNVDFLMDYLKNFLEKEENVYNMEVQQALVTDTLVVTAKMITTSYPATEAVYMLVKKLEDYIGSQGAMAVSAPMLHVEKQDSSRFQAMVGIPVNKVLPDNQDIKFKRLVAGYIMIAEVKGGPQTVKQAIRQMQYYIDDHKKVSPAIPFEMMVTDRLQTKDTTQWITKIYYPVL